jgi:hypothetical protein
MKLLCKKVLNFAVTNAVFNLDMACVAESVSFKLPSLVGMEFSWKIRFMLEKSKLLSSNITRIESRALKSLKRNREIKVLPADKGNFTVVLNDSAYKQKDIQSIRIRSV